jgi:hypothetical protein
LAPHAPAAAVDGDQNIAFGTATVLEMGNDAPVDALLVALEGAPR